MSPEQGKIACQMSETDIFVPATSLAAVDTCGACGSDHALAFACFC